MIGIQHRITRRQFALCVLVLVSLAAALRLDGLTDRSIWFDEASAWACVDQFDVAGIVASCQQNVHPPLFYLLLKTWVSTFGDSLASLRGLPVLFGVLTVVGVVLLASEVAPDGVNARLAGTLAGLICTLSAFQILWSAQCRMYSLGTCLTVFSTWQLIRLYRSADGPSPLKWTARVPYWLLATGLVYTHNYGLFVIVAHATFVVVFPVAQETKISPTSAVAASSHLKAGMSAAGRFAGLILPVAVCYIPWVGVLFRQTSQVRADYWIPPIRPDSLPLAWQQLLMPGDPEPQSSMLSWILATFVLWVCVVAWRFRGHRVKLCVLLVLVPTFAALVVSLLVAPILVARYLLFAHIGFCVCLGVLTASIRNQVVRCVAVCAIVVFLVTSHWHLRTELDAQDRQGVRAIARSVFAATDSDDLILVATPSIYHAFVFHLKEQARDTTSRASVYLLANSKDLSHYNGRPVIERSFVWTVNDLADRDPQTFWLIDTTGYHGFFSHAVIHDSWQRDPTVGFRETEVFQFQGSVSADLWKRQQ